MDAKTAAFLLALGLVAASAAAIALFFARRRALSRARLAEEAAGFVRDAVRACDLASGREPQTRFSARQVLAGLTRQGRKSHNTLINSPETASLLVRLADDASCAGEAMGDLDEGGAMHYLSHVQGTCREFAGVTPESGRAWSEPPPPAAPPLAEALAAGS